MGWLAAQEIDDVDDLISGLREGSLRAWFAARDVDNVDDLIDSLGEGSLKA